MVDLRIGCSGFLYDHWRGTFYPEDLPKNHWLEYYSRHFSTVELNVTFYRLPERETFAKWYVLTPDDFVFSLKGSRFVTHVKKLKDCAEPIEAFFSRASVLKEKLGVILWQLPPNFNLDIERFKEFLEALKPYNMRNTFEFRNKTWINKKIFTLLERKMQHSAWRIILNISIIFRLLPILCISEGTGKKEAMQHHTLPNP